MPYKNKEKHNEYMRGYRIDHAVKIAKQTYARKAKKKSKKYQDIVGHVEMVYNAAKRWAHSKGIDICSEKEFKDWSMDSKSGYPALHNRWAGDGFSDNSPMVTRKNPKKPYETQNLHWTDKKTTGITNEQKTKKQKLEALRNEINHPVVNNKPPLSPNEFESSWITQEIARRQSQSQGEAK